MPWVYHVDIYVSFSFSCCNSMVFFCLLTILLCRVLACTYLIIVFIRFFLEKLGDRQI